MQKQDLQQSSIEFANTITYIQLAQNRHMTNELVDALKSINNIAYNSNLAV